MVSALETPDRAVWVRILTGDILFCSLSVSPPRGITGGADGLV